MRLWWHRGINSRGIAIGVNHRIWLQLRLHCWCCTIEHGGLKLSKWYQELRHWNSRCRVGTQQRMIIWLVRIYCGRGILCLFRKTRMTHLEQPSTCGERQNWARCRGWSEGRRQQRSGGRQVVRGCPRNFVAPTYPFNWIIVLRCSYGWQHFQRWTAKMVK